MQITYDDNLKSHTSETNRNFGFYIHIKLYKWYSISTAQIVEVSKFS